MGLQVREACRMLLKLVSLALWSELFLLLRGDNWEKASGACRQFHGPLFMTANALHAGM